eukprot:scaffold1397_cov254-Pinguiococcus_pyrenoidosus.AAC.30
MRRCAGRLLPCRVPLLDSSREKVVGQAKKSTAAVKPGGLHVGKLRLQGVKHREHDDVEDGDLDRKLQVATQEVEDRRLERRLSEEIAGLPVHSDRQRDEEEEEKKVYEEGQARPSQMVPS